MRKILYVDMDNVLVDFSSGIARLDEKIVREFDGRLDEVPGIFALMRPVEGAVDSFVTLAGHFDAYVLSTSPWENPSAWSDKLEWVKKYLGSHAYKRLIRTHHKNLNLGDYLIDDRTTRGADKFKGEHIHFGSEKFPDWRSVVAYLLKQKT
jgi:5'-nucleotidase